MLITYYKPNYSSGSKFSLQSIINPLLLNRLHNTTSLLITELSLTYEERERGRLGNILSALRVDFLIHFDSDSSEAVFVYFARFCAWRLNGSGSWSSSKRRGMLEGLDGCF